MHKTNTVAALGLCALWLCASATAQPAPTCTLTPAFERPDQGGARTVTVYAADPDPANNGRRPLLFVVDSVHVNTDGTRISYHRDDPRAQSRAINDIRNAMRSGHTIAEFETAARNNWLPLEQTWRVLSASVIEKNKTTGAPCVDREGYLVSKTADVAVAGGWARDGDCDQTKWIDALTVPAVVIPMSSQFQAAGTATRSPVVMMSLTGPRHVGFGIVGDTGPVNELGEASVAMNRDLLGLPQDAVPANRADANRRFEGPRSVSLVFPGSGSRLPYPLTGGAVRSAVAARFAAWGGEERLLQCVAQIPAGH